MQQEEIKKRKRRRKEKKKKGEVQQWQQQLQSWYYNSASKKKNPFTFDDILYGDWNDHVYANVIGTSILNGCGKKGLIKVK